MNVATWRVHRLIHSLTLPYDGLTTRTSSVELVSERTHKFAVVVTTPFVALMENKLLPLPPVEEYTSSLDATPDMLAFAV